MPVLSLPVFVELAARASVILAASGLVAAALRRSSASARHLVWVLGLITALVVPAVSMAVPKWELPIVKVAAPSSAIPHAIPAEAGSYRANGNHLVARGELPAAPGFSREDHNVPSISIAANRISPS